MLRLLLSCLPMLCLLFSVSARADAILDTARAIELRLNARVGLSVLDLQTGQRWRYHADERFPLNSTFKTFACAALLKQVDNHEKRLDDRRSIQTTQLLDYAPVTSRHADTHGMTLGELCAAAMQWSDNTAANLILNEIGGPAGLTAFWRAHGDRISRLDRTEPSLNEATPGDSRDTSTPDANLRSLQELTLGQILSPSSRQQLIRWMKDNQVAGPLLRTHLPHGWQIADRTGAGDHGSRSIQAVVWPKNRQPVLISLYITQTTASMSARNQAIAEFGQILFTTLEQDTQP